MTTYDLIVRNGTVVTEVGVGLSDVAVADGQIVAVEPEIDGTASETIDARGLHLFPGLIDAHVHFNEPGRTDWEGWRTGSRALAAGGGTCGFDMPLNAHPPTIDGPSFDAKLAAAEAEAVTDFALWGGLVPGNRERIPELAERGVIGLKAFMSRSGTADFVAADDLTLYEGMIAAKNHGLIVAVHAESDVITAALSARAVAAGRVAVRDYLDSRPIVAELEAIQRALFLAAETGCALHIVHVSSGRGVAAIVEAQSRGVDVSCETCAHYLVFTDEDVERIGANAKCAPPIRGAVDRDALWQAVRTGAIAMITSDHSPSPPEMKQVDDFFAVWGGIAGCQSTLPAVLTAGYHQRGIRLQTLAAATSGAVARRFAVPSKGRLAVGADADIALVALGDQSVLRQSDLHDRHRLSPYVGMSFTGSVVRTIVRGRTVFVDGRIVGEAGGKLVRPQ